MKKKNFTIVLDELDNFLTLALSCLLNPGTHLGLTSFLFVSIFIERFPLLYIHVEKLGTAV